MVEIEPLPGERLILKAKPHPLAFWHLSVISGIVICLGLAIRWVYASLANLQWLRSLFTIPLLGRFNVAHLLIYWTVLISVAVIMGLVYIRVTPVLLFGSIALVGTVMTEYLKMPLETHVWLLVCSGLAGFVITELYRQGHSYYITNLRLIMQKRFISCDSRQLAPRQISDISVVQGLLGRIFNFGTVIPVTVSGFGLGQDSAMAGLSGGIRLRASTPNPLGVGGGISASGGRAVQLPRGRTYHALYGVTRPNDVADAIARLVLRSG